MLYHLVLAGRSCTNRRVAGAMHGEALGSPAGGALRMFWHVLFRRCYGLPPMRSDDMA